MERWLSFKCLNSVERSWLTIKSWSSKSMFPPPDPSLFVSPLTLATLGCRVLTPLAIKRQGKQVQISKQANKVTEQSLLTALHIFAKDPAGKYWETLSISHWFIVPWSHSQKNSYFSLPSPCSLLCKGILQGKKIHNIEIPPPQILSLGILLSPSQRGKASAPLPTFQSATCFSMRFHVIPWQFNSSPTIHEILAQSIPLKTWQHTIIFHVILVSKNVNKLIWSFRTPHISCFVPYSWICLKLYSV